MVRCAAFSQLSDKRISILKYIFDILKGVDLCLDPIIKSEKSEHQLNMYRLVTHYMKCLKVQHQARFEKKLCWFIHPSRLQEVQTLLPTTTVTSVGVFSISF